MNYRDYVKSQVSPENWAIVETMHLNLDGEWLARVWSRYVDAPQRWKTELPFLVEQLMEYYLPVDGDSPSDRGKTPTVFDAAAGSGATSIGLKLLGMDVFPNEMDDALRSALRKEALRYGLIDATGKGLSWATNGLFLTSYTWDSLPKDDFKPRYDAVLCLGNSLTYLHKRNDQLTALSNFRRVLRPGGKLIIDERNYPEMLKGNFRHDQSLLYCGNSLSAVPLHTYTSMVILEIADKKNKGHLIMYPFKEGELEGLLRETGFKNIKRYGDYHSEFKPENVSFFTYVARK